MAKSIASDPIVFLEHAGIHYSGLSQQHKHDWPSLLTAETSPFSGETECREESAVARFLLQRNRAWRAGYDRRLR